MKKQSGSLALLVERILSYTIRDYRHCMLNTLCLIDMYKINYFVDYFMRLREADFAIFMCICVNSSMY